MREGEPSRTALGAAVHRAVHQELDDARIFRDPLIWRMAGVDRERAIADAAGRDRLRLFIAMRHRFAEDSLAAAVSRGVRQVVVLGAGLETFPYRNPHAGTRVFEVDHPATQEWKQARVAEAGIEVPEDLTYVPVDFERDDLVHELTGAGFDPDQPAFFLWLGVVPYLDRESVDATLRAIASVPGSEVVLDYTNPSDQLPPEERRARDELDRRVAEVGEPLSDGLDTGGLHARLRELGFTEIEDLARPELRARFLGLPAAGESFGGHVLRARLG